MSSQQNPPRWAHQLLEKFCPHHLIEEVEGDLLEEYQYQLKKYGAPKANRDYVISVFAFLSPFSRRRKSEHPSPSLLHTIMWKNYFITALRNISRNRTYSIINLMGLTLGLVSCMLIFQYVIYEKSADQFHQNSDNLYRVVFEVSTAGGTKKTRAQIPLGGGDTFKDEIPDVVNFCRIRADFFQEGPSLSYTRNGDVTVFKDLRSIMVDSSFFDMFSFPLIAGDPETALTTPRAILITESLAKRIFGDEDPIGKNLDYSLTQGVQPHQVTGVLKDAPSNSHIQFDVVSSVETYLTNTRSRGHEEPWDFAEFTTYVQLKNDDSDKIASMMDAVVKDKIGEQLKQANITLSVRLQPMHSVYFDRNTDLGTIGFGSAIVATRTGNERMVYFFTVIAIITLSIALMSYINLSTVRSLDRAKEVGIRKVIGAYSRNLRMQFFMESTMMNLSGLLIAVVLVILLVPYFNEFVQTDLTLATWFNKKFLLLIGGIFIAGVLLSGLYPAFILSSFMPIAVLKGSVGSVGSKSRARKLLIVLQYAPAIALLVCTIIVYSQLSFMRNMDVGLNMKQLISIASPRFIPDSIPSRTAEASFKKEVLKIRDVEVASYAGNQAGRGLNFRAPFRVDSVGDGGVHEVKCSGIDHDFAGVFGLKILAGEMFTENMSPLHGNPDDFVRKVMINETTAQLWGIKNYDDAVGRIVNAEGEGRYYVLGVIEDFQWASAHKSTDPVMLWYTPNNRFMTIRMKEGADFNSMVSEIESVYNDLFPKDMFSYEFVDDVYQLQYGEDERFSKLFGIFSGLAALIASMGLFGLAAFSAERRSKEVGIRKVLGATVNNIVGLLGKEFVILVLIAFVIASPIAWFVMSAWLQTFAFHMPLNATPFIITGITAVLIAAVTVSWRTIGVAKANPINALKDQ